MYHRLEVPRSGSTHQPLDVRIEIEPAPDGLRLWVATVNHGGSGSQVRVLLDGGQLVDLANALRVEALATGRIRDW